MGEAMRRTLAGTMDVQIIAGEGMRIIQIAAATSWSSGTDHAGAQQGQGKVVLFALCENGRVAWMEPDGYRNNWEPLLGVPDGLFDVPIERRTRRRQTP
jgi:hypothetical protein